jgi:hypothetical protein
MGKSGKAVELIEHVVNIRESTVAQDHPNRNALQYVLSCAYQANGKVREAKELPKQKTES